MGRIGLTKETALKDSRIKKRIYDVLLKKEMTVYDLTKILFRDELKKRKYSRRFYERVRHHVFKMVDLGLVKLSRTTKEPLNRPVDETPSKRGDVKNPVIIERKYYKSILQKNDDNQKI